MSNGHTFHIPVMGTGFSIDSPIKVAQYGISSVISIVDDVLIEQMREFYCEKSGEEYVSIRKYNFDFRAKRITEYLNLVRRIVNRQFDELRVSPFEEGSEITKYFELLPETCSLRILYSEMLRINNSKVKMEMQERLRSSLTMGDINVNIMTKLDRMNYTEDGTPLPSEFSDALAALRGFALSELQSAIVFSAGINQRLYSYVAEFEDFYADEKGYIKKRVILKVSDYRSAFIQGKFFARKGIWVSEYRVESGLNCGGHVFPTEGYLMGPILEEFKNKRQEMIDTLFEIYREALIAKGREVFPYPPVIKITAQGGIGTARENGFLHTYYQVDGTGWGTPFLLCPEVTNVDEETLKRLVAAKEEDLYVSDVSPLGIPFNNIRGSMSDLAKEKRLIEGRPGSACPKGYLVSNVEFTDQPICTASRQYQKLKLEQLEKANLPEEEYQRQYRTVVEKACICNDLGGGVIVRNKLLPQQQHFPAVCPGPNIAYFSRIVTLKEMVDHIYGRLNLLNAHNRSHMFIKELELYIQYFIKEVKKAAPTFTVKQVQYFNGFKNNLLDGIEYYRELFPKIREETEIYRIKTLQRLLTLKSSLMNFLQGYQSVFSLKEESILGVIT